jgi:prepilin-type N-terminal cleavage/methylation domain-containing protein
MKINKQNNKGFTLIELIMVTIILGILAAVAIPRYVATVTRAEAAAEDAVISSIRAGLETYATEQLMDNGRRGWPVNPFDGLETTPDGFTSDITDADVDAEWTFNSTSNAITHMRGDNTVHHWDYVQGVTTSGSEAVGTLSARFSGTSI